jgi:hypothetical protein
VSVNTEGGDCFRGTIAKAVNRAGEQARQDRSLSHDENRPRGEDLPLGTERRKRHRRTLRAGYRDGKQWKDSSSFGRDDLPLLAKVADRVHSWIFEQTSQQNGSQNHEQDGPATEDGSDGNGEPHF